MWDSKVRRNCLEAPVVALCELVVKENLQHNEEERTVERLLFVFVLVIRNFLSLLSFFLLFLGGFKKLPRKGELETQQRGEKMFKRLLLMLVF